MENTENTAAAPAVEETTTNADMEGAALNPSAPVSDTDSSVGTDGDSATPATPAEGAE